MLDELPTIANDIPVGLEGQNTNETQPTIDPELIQYVGDIELDITDPNTTSLLT